MLGDRAEIRVQLPVILGNDSELEPDLTVVREETTYREELILNSSDSIAMQAFPDIAIALDAMFPIAKN